MGITSTMGTSSLSSEKDTKRIAIVNTWTFNDLSSGELAGTVKIRYQYSNHLGSASLELNDVGEFVSYQEYFPFGETAYTYGTVSTEYRFTGKERDSFTGLYYFGARYYAPWMFRWMNPDPSGPVDGLNVFVYVSNRPIVMVDPNGKKSIAALQQGLNPVGDQTGNATPTNIPVVTKSQVLPIEDNGGFIFNPHVTDTIQNMPKEMHPNVKEAFERIQTHYYYQNELLSERTGNGAIFNYVVGGRSKSIDDTQFLLMQAQDVSCRILMSMASAGQAKANVNSTVTGLQNGSLYVHEHSNGLGISVQQSEPLQPFNMSEAEKIAINSMKPPGNGSGKGGGVQVPAASNLSIKTPVFFDPEIKGGKSNNNWNIKLPNHPVVIKVGENGVTLNSYPAFNRLLYRGERSTVTPELVFNQGFIPKGTHNDPHLHTKSNTTAGNFISASSIFDIAQGYTKKNGYLYEFVTSRGIDQRATYGKSAAYPEQYEVSVPGGVLPSEIKGAWVYKGGINTGVYISNPNFQSQ